MSPPTRRRPRAEGATEITGQAINTDDSTPEGHDARAVARSFARVAKDKLAHAIDGSESDHDFTLSLIEATRALDAATRCWQRRGAGDR